MNKAAVYVFSDAQCMELGFTMSFCYFKCLQEAEAYAAHFEFARVVEF